MTNRNFFFAVFACLFFFSSCDDDAVTTSETNNPNGNSKNFIMPLGASRVEGARPAFESYRYELWKMMIDGGWEFDYIGTQKDEANYPEYAAASFDNEHEGRGGWTSGQILDGINNWLADAGSPDIVLFSSPGGNDALSGLPYDDAVSNVNAIIDAIQTANPNVTIIIEQMAPARSDEMTPELTLYFEKMQQEVVTIAMEQSTNNSQVFVVDMFTDFSDLLLADDVHYSAEGAGFVAERYYDVLVNILQE